jgi:cbb3-type cytochrome oxidase subunit 1
MLMDLFVIRFLRASLAWLAMGVTLGVCMAVHPAWTIYRPAHLHMLLLGFVTMMIAGVGYHVLPRFAGAPLHSPRVAGMHWIASNLGLVLLASGFIVRMHDVTIGAWLLGVGGTLSAAGAYAMAWNLWRTLDKAAVPPSRLMSTGRPLTVAPNAGATRGGVTHVGATHAGATHASPLRDGVR